MIIVYILDGVQDGFMKILLSYYKYFQKYVIFDAVKELRPFMLNKWLLFIQRVISNSLTSQDGVKDGFQNI